MIRNRYADVLAAGRTPPRPRSPCAPLVSVVVPYFELDPFVEETLRSIEAQSYPRIETIVVNDGSLREEDRVLERLAERYPIRLVTQQNQGLGAARNFGIMHALGRFILPLDADDLIATDFVQACVDALVAAPELAYVGTWSRYVDEHGAPIPGADPGYAPLGNWSDMVMQQNVAASASAVVRRWLFDDGFEYSRELTSYEDWLFYLQLHQAGHYGDLIPRTLLSYRVRTASMMRTTGVVRWERQRGEVLARAAEGSVKWTSVSA